MVIKEKLEQNHIRPVAYTGSNMGTYGLSGYCVPKKINKEWGHELIFQNHELYCCKLLYINANKSCSYHLHLNKHETLLVVEGVLFIDTTHNKKETTWIVKEGEAFVVAPGFIHSLRAKDQDVILIESSTPSYDTDSIRIKNGK
jgi:mannose-6-phosphate isomerase-like protein (cupin superfamily)